MTRCPSAKSLTSMGEAIMAAQKISTYRTDPQKAAIERAVSVGYEHERDSEYRLGRKKGAQRVGCLVILSGRVTGSNRVMVIYPDGSVETQAQQGRSSKVTFHQSKLSHALAEHGFVIYR